MIIGIACCDQQWGIGKNNKLLFNIPEDMSYFKSHTYGHVVVMGRKTLESLPGQEPLKDRLNIVLTSKDNIENCFCVHSLEDLMYVVKSIQEDIYIIGGASIYEQFYPYFDKILITKVQCIEDADAFFPHDSINKLFKVTERSEVCEFDGYKYQFLTYERKVE